MDRSTSFILYHRLYLASMSPSAGASRSTYDLTLRGSVILLMNRRNGRAISSWVSQGPYKKLKGCSTFLPPGIQRHAGWGRGLRECKGLDDSWSTLVLGSTTESNTWNLVQGCSWHGSRGLERGRNKSRREHGWCTGIHKRWHTHGVASRHEANGHRVAEHWPWASKAKSVRHGWRLLLCCWVDMVGIQDVVVE